MKTYLPKILLNSIALKLLILILVTTIPLVSLLIFINMQSRNTLLNQVNDTHTNMLESYVSQIENQLSSAYSYTIRLSTYENNTQIIALSQDEAFVQYAKIWVSKDLSEKLVTYNFINGFFVTVQEQSGYDNFISTTGGSVSSLSSAALRSFVSDYIASGSEEGHWQLCNIGDSPYLFQIISNPDGIRAGAYISLEQLLAKFSPGNIPESQLLFLPNEEIALYEQSLSQDTQLVSYPLASAPISLIETFPNTAIMDTLPFMQKYTKMVSVALVALVATFICFVYKIVTIPLWKLTKSMQEIQNGNLDYRIPASPASSEIQMVNHTFNQMIDEVQNLKINIYEEQLNTQKSQLRILQMQVKPHFLINALNMVYNLVETERLPLAKKLIKNSVNYFRYMMKIDEDLVPLMEELGHVKSYLEIQSLRYQNNFTYSITIDPKIEDMLIPPIMIQNFVENSMKYALSLTEIIEINIQITSFEKDYFPYAKIVVSDSGDGYPEEQLELLNAGQKIVKEDGECVGVRNTVHRLKILFGGKAQWRFYNSKGAVSEIIIPATFDEFEN